MLNQVILVGKVTGIYDFVTSAGNPEELLISLLVTNVNETENHTDEINVRLSRHLSNAIKEHIEVGSMIGVKAHLEIIVKDLTVVADKVTFISLDKTKDIDYDKYIDGANEV
ncbi:single-stranded DNA-binding protein [Candidatus Xianfuyuplasma coldseepsis]|uniref:Single-stranded DNA-binding protein n=1 Tax=Candidatus Xianfuyuplasma coldseepsis TaxID=2782163 RepID=A0A7L7KPW0_9MOLU|nr:single-stranded DNA-binding protein [Xianfuyuplasma coldseepsis]QMS84831.1 single-stranded DNA-binding protein [Xianfuyuplasma coldseepsis]